MYSSICSRVSDTRFFLRHFGMLTRQFDERVTSRGLPRSALHYPFRRLEMNRPYRNPEFGGDLLPDVLLNGIGEEQILGIFDFRHDNEILSAQRWIEPTECDRAAVGYSGGGSHDFLAIVRMEIPANNDN